MSDVKKDTLDSLIESEDYLNDDGGSDLKCETCDDTGWYGENGPGVHGNTEVVQCDCGANVKCNIGAHPYSVVCGIPWCDLCNKEADVSSCRRREIPQWEIQDAAF